MGIKLKREWIATLDGRTRHAHAMLDGQKAEIGKPFKVDGYDIMFPGDKSAPAYLVYNCRCTMISAVDGVASSAKRRARNPEAVENELISNMTYQEWAGWKKKSTVMLENYKKSGKLNIGFQFFANKGISKQNDRELTKSISSWKDQIAAHRKKLVNPAEADSGWETKPENQRQGLIRHWEKEIRVFQANIDEAETELQRRKESK